MTKRDNNGVRTTSIIERSVNSLQWFYTMVLSLSVILAVQQFIGIENDSIKIHSEYFANFIVFLIIVIPFYQGANRYLDETYIVNSGGKKKLSGMIDFLFFFIEGIIFYVMALSLKNNIDFYYSIIVVFAIDVIWLASVFINNDAMFKKVKSWFWLNIGAGIIILIFISLNSIEENMKYIILAVLMVLRTLLDYIFSWPFYWPGITNEEEPE